MRAEVLATGSSHRRLRARIATRIVAAALGFVLPLAVLAWLVCDHEWRELATTEREQAGLAYVRPALSTLAAVRDARLVVARCDAVGAPCERERSNAFAAVDQALSELERVHAQRGHELDVAASALARDTAPRALRAAWDEAMGALRDRPVALEIATTGDAVSDEVAEFAALRPPAPEARSTTRDPVMALETSLASLIVHVAHASGLEVDRDLDSGPAIDAALDTLPVLGGDLVRLTLLRGRPSDGASSESSALAQLVSERELPVLLARLESARDADAGSWGTSDELQRLVPEIVSRLAEPTRAHAATVPAHDALERLAYLDAGTALVREAGTSSLELVDAAGTLLAIRASATRTRLSLSLGLAGLVTLLTGFAFMRAIRSVLRPLSELAEGAARLAGGDLTARVEVQHDDEVGRVASAFNAMAGAVAERDARLKLHAEELEMLVARKTASLQAILDGMGEGLIVVDGRGRLLAERSLCIEQWFGPLEPGMPIGRYLAKDDPLLADELQLGIEEIDADVLPFELLAAQMPQQIRHGARELRVAYRLAASADGERQIVVTLRDATAEIASERLDRQQRELPVLVANLARNRHAFQASIEELEQVLAGIGDGSEDEASRMRGLHTLKGVSAMLGFVSFATECHRLEDVIAERGIEALDDHGYDALSAAWASASAPLRTMLRESGGRGVEVADEELEHLTEAIERGVDHAELLDEVGSWRRDRVSDALHPCVTQAAMLAERLGKRIDVVIEGGEARIPEGPYRTFFGTLVHVVRNAVDHGMELPSARVGAGKTPHGTLRIGVDGSTKGVLSVRVEDDGAGIDWSRVRTKARSLGLGAESHAELVAALFADGMSTAESISDVSGRGIGLSAVAQACERLHGRIDVVSRPGEGTTFVFELRGGPVTQRPVGARAVAA